ncbi:hypothetical protein [Bdellovibrio sp. HCB2-146]
MALFRYIFDRIFNSRPFYYAWEERKFQRHHEQGSLTAQFTCRHNRD